MRSSIVVATAAVAVSLCAAAEASAALNFCDGGPRSCTSVTVPLDRSNGVPGTISLHVERAEADKPVRPPLFMLVGEPGASNTRTDGLLEETIGSEQRSRDVIVMDLRGTGRSGVLRCPSLENRRRHTAAAGAACAAALGPRRAFYAAADSAADIEAVRRSLGAPRIALLGMSYGTRAAMEYARRYPANVERLILDSPVGPDGFDTLRRSEMRATPNVLRALCRRGRCRSFTRDITADLARLAARIEARPQRGIFVDRWGRRHRRALATADLFETLAAGDANFFSFQAMAAALHDALKGDPAPLLRLRQRAAQSHGFRAPREVSAGAYAAALCEDAVLPWPRDTPLAQRRSRATALVAGQPPGTFGPFGSGAALGADALELCERWPSSERHVPAAGPLPPVPTVIYVAGAQNHRPLEDARSVARLIPGSRLVVTPGAAGDGVLQGAGYDCLSEELARFLAGGEPRRCKISGLPQPFPPLSKVLGQMRPDGIGGRRGRTIAALRMTLVDGMLELYSDLFAALFVRQDPGNYYMSTLRAGGLRAGRYAAHVPRNVYVLHGASYVRGIRVWGRLTEHDDTDDDLARGPGWLRIGGPAAARGTLRIRDGIVTGKLGGRPIRLRVLPRGQKLGGFGDLGR
jgi:pimeloyl-ACP methyl ester carboxylesterase